MAVFVKKKGKDPGCFYHPHGVPLPDPVGKILGWGIFLHT